MNRQEQKIYSFAAKLLNWGSARFITGPEGQGTALGQLEKTVEEAKETAAAIASNNLPEIIDGIGDVFVTLVMAGERLKLRFGHWIYEPLSGDTRTDALTVANDMVARAEALRDLCASAETKIDTIKMRNEFQDGLTDLYTDLLQICNLQGLLIDRCIEAAWNQIKDRKGRMIDGKFVKEAQP